MALEDAERLEARSAEVSKLLGHRIDRSHPSPRSLGYRARVELKTDDDGRLGYHRPRSHEHVAVSDCAIARPELNEVLGRLPALRGIPVVELRTDGTRVVLAAKLQRRGLPPPNRRSRADAERSLHDLDLTACGLAGVALEGRHLRGDSRVRIEAAGVEHHLSPATFFQVNLEVNEALVGRVVELVQSRQPTAVLDLYAGAGNLSMPLAAAGVPVTQVELAGSSVRDAKATAKREGLSVTFRAGDAGKFSAGDSFFDIAILDPPRAGAPGLLPELLLTRPRAVAYISCEPRSLARDLRPLGELGYEVTLLELFDMFPQTHHVETLCLLERRSR